MTDCAIILSCGFLVDALVGDPRYRLHPVRLMGKLCVVLERLCRRIRLDGCGGGLLLVSGMLVTVCGTVLGLHWLCSLLHPALAYGFDIFTVTSCIAQRDLVRHAHAVSLALTRDDLGGAQEAVQRFVGRDARQLDGAGVARAAVESVSEGFVDGILSPFFWYTIGAIMAWAAGWPLVPGALVAMTAFKTVSTLDSMVGYRNETYLRFGRASAKLDDVMNFVPARLSIAALSAAATLCGADTGAGWRVMRRDARKHPSPNAGFPESYVAGALGVRLGGPTVYPHGIVEKPWFGSGADEAGARHIHRAGRLVVCAGWVSITLCVTLLMVVKS